MSKDHENLHTPCALKHIGCQKNSDFFEFFFELPVQSGQNLVLDETYLVLRFEGPNVYQKILRDQVYTFGELEGPKTYFSLCISIESRHVLVSLYKLSMTCTTRTYACNPYIY